MDILDLLRRPEGKTLEFKRDASSPAALLRTIIAFANTSGGTLLIGVEDGAGHIRGVQDPMALEERLTKVIRDSISPRILPSIEILSSRNAHVAAIQVFPSQSRPHYLARTGLGSATYVRVGSNNRRADDALIQEMQRFTRGECFDECPMPELDSEAIDFPAASELFAPVRKFARKDLEKLRLVATHQGRRVPTVAGVLLFGPDRLEHFPAAWIQLDRFAGTSRKRILDHAESQSNLVMAIGDAIAFIEKHATPAADIGRMRRMEHWSLPPAAVREAVINAVVHADYAQRGAPIRVAMFDDRLEVESPGLLPFGLTVADLPLGVSKLRNRVMGRVFHELGLVDHWGSGVQRMIAVCRDAGLPDPVFEEVGLRFRVTFRTERTGDPVLDTTDEAILELLDAPEGRATREIAKGIGLTPRATRTRLADLVDRGLIREIGTGPQDPRRRYYLTGRP